MRLIDAEALNHAVSNIDMHGRSEQFYEIMGEIAEVLSSAPIIDAEPVRHGRWVNSRCTVCNDGWALCNDYGEVLDSPYCPWCGAKMDADDKKEG